VAVGYFSGRLSKELMFLSASLNRPGEGRLQSRTPEDLVNKDELLKSTAAMQKPYDGWPYTPGYCYKG